MLVMLDNLGTPDAIAGFLTEEGVTGTCGSGTQDVISNWLRTLTDKPVFVSDALVTIGGINIMTRANLQAFILRYDCGKYPQLCRNKNWEDTARRAAQRAYLGLIRRQKYDDTITEEEIFEFAALSGIR